MFLPISDIVVGRIGRCRGDKTRNFSSFQVNLSSAFGLVAFGLDGKSAFFPAPPAHRFRPFPRGDFLADGAST